MPGEHEAPAAARSTDDLSDLHELLRFVAGWLKRHDALAEKLGLGERFEGPLAEGLAAVGLGNRLGPEIRDLRDVHGDSAGHGIELTLKNGRKPRVVVKSLSGERFHPLALVGMDDWEPAPRETAHGEDGSFRLPATARAELGRQVDERVPQEGPVYWILVSTGDASPEFYVLDRQDLKACILGEYEERRRRKSHELEYASDRSPEGGLQAVPQPAGWKAILSSCKGRFDKILADE